MKSPRGFNPSAWDLEQLENPIANPVLAQPVNWINVHQRRNGLRCIRMNQPDAAGRIRWQNVLPAGATRKQRAKIMRDRIETCSLQSGIGELGSSRYPARLRQETRENNGSRLQIG